MCLFSCLLKKQHTFALQKQSNGSTIFALTFLEAMIIKRDHYVEALLSKRWNGKVKIVTGIRRCGKSFLLSTLYKEHLKTEGVPDDCFVEIALDRKADLKYRNPYELYKYVRQALRHQGETLFREYAEILFYGSGPEKCQA